MRVPLAITTPTMLNRLLLEFPFVRGLQLEIEAIRRDKKEAGAMVEELVEKIDEMEASATSLRHSLEIESAKRIAAEQIAVSRGTELEWLRGQFQRVEEQREAARHDQLQSLDLVNTALLVKAQADAPPTKEQLEQWKPVPKLTQQSVPLMRRAQYAFIEGLRNKTRAATAPVIEKVQ